MKKNMIILVILGSLLLLSGCDILFSDNDPIPFNREKWLEDEEIRHRMVDDLTENYLYIGISKVEVESIIGIGEEVYNKEYIYYYFMGTIGTSFNYELYISYDEYEKLTEHKVIKAYW